MPKNAQAHPLPPGRMSALICWRGAYLLAAWMRVGKLSGRVAYYCAVVLDWCGKWGTRGMLVAWASVDRLGVLRHSHSFLPVASPLLTSPLVTSVAYAILGS